MSLAQASFVAQSVDDVRAVQLRDGVAYYAYLTPGQLEYRYDRASAAADDGVNTIKPNSVSASSPGRWLRSSPVAAHEAATDPHPQYQRESEKGQVNGYAALDGAGTVPDAQIPAAIARDAEVSAAIAAHEAAGDPHPTYTTGAEASVIAAAAVAAHEAASDPHAVYQKESEKGAANGYASLDANGAVGEPAKKIRETGGPTVLDVGAIPDGQFLKRVGATVVGAAGGGGGGTFGQVTADFGLTNPGSVVVTVADPGVTTASRIVASVAIPSSRDLDEMELAPVQVAPGNIVNGVSFDLIAVSPDNEADGQYLLNYTRD